MSHKPSYSDAPCCDMHPSHYRTPRTIEQAFGPTACYKGLESSKRSHKRWMRVYAFFLVILALAVWLIPIIPGAVR